MASAAPGPVHVPELRGLYQVSVSESALEFPVGYDIETATEVYTKGIYTAGKLVSESSKGIVDKVHKKVKGCLDDGKFVVKMYKQ